MCFRRNKYDDFEQWCDAINELPYGTNLAFSEYRKGDQITLEDRGARFHEAVIKLINADQEQRGRISINHPEWENRSFNIDLSSQANREGITSSTRPDLLDVDTGHLGALRMVSTNVRHLHLGQATKSVDLINCRIGTLALGTTTVGNLHIRDCWIGRLELRSSGVGNISVKDGTIRSLSCPSTADSNPIAGSASFSGVNFPTDLKPGWRENAQPYRNLRKHLEDLEDIPNANRMRTLELATERHTDRGFNKFWNYIWGWFANYGYSPGRPLWWVLGLYLVTALGLWTWDGGALTQNANTYGGWEVWFTRHDWFAATYLPLRPIISPLGALGGGSPVVAATLGGKLALVVQGIATYLLIGMTAIGVRKRFKLH